MSEIPVVGGSDLFALKAFPVSSRGLPQDCQELHPEPIPLQYALYNIRFYTAPP